MTLNTLHDFDDHVCDVGYAQVPGGWQGEYRIERGGATIYRDRTQKVESTPDLAESDALQAAKTWVLRSQGTTAAVNAGVYEMGSHQIAHEARQWIKKNLHDTSNFLEVFQNAQLIASPGRK